MSEYELIPAEAYEGPPDDPHDKFVKLVGVAQSNLARLLDQSNSGDFADEIRSQFISIISGIAEASDIGGLPPMGPSIGRYDTYQTFQVFLAGVVARVRIQGKLEPRPFSVELGRVTRAKIQQEIEQLRRSIGDSELPEDKRKALLDKLDELDEELAKKRLSFARTMAIAASIMAVVGGGAAALANAPKAIESLMTIIRFIGNDKEKEEAERLRLMPPPKALPDFSLSAPSPSFGDDLDDDVPF